ncbi:MAG: hypothetical protein JSW21_07355 [Gammaproteobacteria bacterium]|nr:MAG: hypothetical protein JSW21_07355 [Gammaproteobacteria bacterium]
MMYRTLITWLGIQRPAYRFILVLALTIAAGANAETLSNEIPSRYYYDDIDRFFVSYECFLDVGEPSAFTSYLEAGTIGLKDFEERFALTPEKLATTVQKYPAFFSSIRNLKSKIRSQEDTLDVMFENLQALFPSHALPEVYFLVGGLRAGGQAGDGNYVIVAAELCADMLGVDVSAVSATSRIFSPEDIVHIVAHEAAHIIQEAEAYGMRHEAELWELLREQALDRTRRLVLLQAEGTPRLAT